MSKDHRSILSCDRTRLLSLLYGMQPITAATNISPIEEDRSPPDHIKELVRRDLAHQLAAFLVDEYQTTSRELTDMFAKEYRITGHWVSQYWMNEVINFVENVRVP